MREISRLARANGRVSRVRPIADRRGCVARAALADRGDQFHVSTLPLGRCSVLVRYRLVEVLREGGSNDVLRARVYAVPCETTWGGVSSRFAAVPVVREFWRIGGGNGRRLRGVSGGSPGLRLRTDQRADASPRRPSAALAQLHAARAVDIAVRTARAVVANADRQCVQGDDAHLLPEGGAR